MKKNNPKGFTLAELLIVVAIIAVLVAISIPVFTSQLAKAKAATDAANIRAGYAVVAAKVLEDMPTTDANYYLQADGTVSATSSEASNYKCKGNADDLPDVDNVYIGNTKAAMIQWAEGDYIAYNYYIDINTEDIGIAAVTP